MSDPIPSLARNLAVVRRFSPPGAVWAAALFCASFVNEKGASALLWGAGSVTIIVIFPWVLVTTLDRRGSLRRRTNRLGASPIILGALGAAFMLLRLILWTDGPQPVAAVVFCMLGAFALSTIVTGNGKPVWADVTYVVALVVLPVLLFQVLPGGVGASAAIAVATLCVSCLLCGGMRSALQTVLTAVVGISAISVFIYLL